MPKLVFARLCVVVALAVSATSMIFLAGPPTPAASQLHAGKTFGGTSSPTWSVLTRYQPDLGAVSDLTCVTSSVCLAVGTTAAPGWPGGGGLYRTTNLGQSWSQISVGLPVYTLNGVACMTSELCFAVGGSGSNNFGIGSNAGVLLKSSDLGSHWQIIAEFPADVLNAISCATATECVVIGDEISVRTTDSGKQWIQSKLPSNNSGIFGASISCPNTAECQAVGVVYSKTGAAPAILTTTSGAASWRIDTTPRNISEFQAVTCSSPTRCMVAATRQGPAAEGSNLFPEILTSTSMGAAWVGTDPFVNATTEGTLTAIDCVGGQSSFCMLTGTVSELEPRLSPGIVMVSSNDGGSWQLRSAPSLVDQFLPSCVSSTLCVMIGSTGQSISFDRFLLAAFATSDGGISWRQRRLPDGLGAAISLACTPTLHCIIGTDSVRNGAVLYGQVSPDRWRQAYIPDGTGMAVACPSQNAC
jgi:photosystem II stability/assembly factor-like uncharacterized protein